MQFIFRFDEGLEKITPERCHILEVFNHTGFSTFSMARARVEPGITTQLHSLTDVDEAYYLLEGTGEVEIEGERKGVVNTGDVVFIPGGSAQRITNTGSTDLIFLCICHPAFTNSVYRNLEAELM